MNIIDEFEWRGMVYQASDGAHAALGAGSVTGYIGFDPSAGSLHVGSLLPVMALARFQRFGHRPIAVVGGGTGLIGDPSGKSQERSLLSKEQVAENLQGIKRQLSRFLDFESKKNDALVINNAEWLVQASTLDFLRDIGKHFTVNYMLAKEATKRRIEKEEGLSFTEFSYLLLQAWDFLVLYDRYNCTLQMGGSDQWGNITAGIDLIRRVRGGRAFGLVFPLLQSASGAKFGKTEAGTIWLDATLTSPFEFYQFWLNTEDRDVISYLKYFTWLSREEINDLEISLAKSPQDRKPHRLLAQEVTRMVHGEQALAQSERASRTLFDGDFSETDDLATALSGVPAVEMPLARFANGLALSELAIACGLAASKSEARRLIDGRGLYLNNRRIDAESGVTHADTIGGRYLIIRKGQKQYRLIYLT